MKPRWCCCDEREDPCCRGGKAAKLFFHLSRDVMSRRRIFHRFSSSRALFHQNIFLFAVASHKKNPIRRAVSFKIQKLVKSKHLRRYILASSLAYMCAATVCAPGWPPQWLATFRVLIEFFFALSSALKSQLPAPFKKNALEITTREKKRKSRNGTLTSQRDGWCHLGTIFLQLEKINKHYSWRCIWAAPFWM